MNDEKERQAKAALSLSLSFSLPDWHPNRPPSTINACHWQYVQETLDTAANDSGYDCRTRRDTVPPMHE